ncbi:MAG TPA: LssY C-terminal domain-containing protein [Candidatus Binatia bacterium]|jgi:hypothetical protein|nr:LssY C-terminal domain-containing protein [Candidatus Binatia bacterium]
MTDVAWALGIALGTYLVLAYLVLPMFWRHYEHLPPMSEFPKYTRTTGGLQGDPLNVALVGTEREIERAFAADGWSAARPITVRSSLGIVESVVLDRPDPTAPVSVLLLWGRKEDLAFERCVGRSARQRHHVRFWKTEVQTEDGRMLWVGAATFDVGVELGHRTGQVTHRIAPDIDSERNRLMETLDGAGQLIRRYAVTGIGPTLSGRNGGGDRYVSDGELYVGVLANEHTAGSARAERLPSPPLVVVKDGLWAWLSPALSSRPTSPPQ